MANAKMMKLILICLLGSGFFVQAQEVNKEFTKLVLNEQFDQPDKNWNSTFNADNLFIAQNGYFELYRQNKQSGYYVFPNKSESYKGFLLESKVLFTSHDNKAQSAGVIVMANESGGGLLIEVNQKKAFRIVRVYKDKQIPINAQSGDGWQKSAAVSKTENTISIKTYDKIYDLYINQTFVKSFTDIELSKGKIGIYVGPNSKVRFDHLSIWEESIKDPSPIDTTKSIDAEQQAYTKVIIKLKEQLQLRERNIEDLKYKLRQCEAQGNTAGIDANQQGQVAQLQSKIIALQNENDTMHLDLVQLENNLEDLQQFKQMIEQGSDGDIVIPLTKLVSQNKQVADSMQRLNKALDAENKTLYIEVKELVKTMDRNGLEIEQLKKANAQHLSTIDSLQKALQQLKASLPAKTDQSIAPELSEEEKLQQMIEKEREERRKRKEEEDKKKSEGNGQ